MNCLLSTFFFNFPKTTYLVWLRLFDCKESCVFQSTHQLPNFSQPFFSITRHLWRIGSWHTCLIVKTWLYSTNLLNQTILVHLIFVARNTLKDFLIQEEVVGNTCCENSSWESRISISVRSLEFKAPNRVVEKFSLLIVCRLVRRSKISQQEGSQETWGWTG